MPFSWVLCWWEYVSSACLMYVCVCMFFECVDTVCVCAYVCVCACVCMSYSYNAQ